MAVAPVVAVVPDGTLWWSEGGGFVWTYLNWALGLRAAGCEVMWVERVDDGDRTDLEERVARLAHCLEPFDLAEGISLCDADGRPLGHSRDLAEADLLLNFHYGASERLVRRSRRAALVDIDPGLLQMWIEAGTLMVAPHDEYFTIGETVGQAEARFPSCDISWTYTPPAVHLESWPVTQSAPGTAYTTVSSWWTSEMLRINGHYIQNDKREGFRGFETLPELTTIPLELALCFGDDEQLEQERLEGFGWQVRNSLDVAGSPLDYRDYVQQSRGEFSGAKPSCALLANAWISDRTICYLASGKPSVVQYTGASRFLPDAGGLFRVRTAEEAADALALIESDYEEHAQLARALAEERFDAERVAARLLDRALA